MRKLILIICLAILGRMTSLAQFNTVVAGRAAKPIYAVCDDRADSLSSVCVLDSIEYIQSPDSSIRVVAALPLAEIRVTSSFGIRKHPITRQRTFHNGVDLAARFEAVYSILPGLVEKVGKDKKAGLYVTVKTENYTVSYCHLAHLFVKQDDEIDAGQVIAQSGNTGRSTGPHLHVVLRHNDKYMDPMCLISAVSDGMMGGL